MRRKRRSKRIRDLIQGFLFFLSTIGTISCLILYLWVFKEIDESLLESGKQSELSDGLKQAFNTAAQTAKKEASGRLSKISGGLDLPGM